MVQIKSVKGNSVIVANKVRKITIEWVLSVFVRFLAIKYEIAKNIVDQKFIFNNVKTIAIVITIAEIVCKILKIELTKGSTFAYKTDISSLVLNLVNSI